ncbi:MAG: hypothetical protein MEQ74_05175 [Paracoccus sp.]|nr:hypothetical protein [Paracoccus sp. (in: a-proteobacteria)]
MTIHTAVSSIFEEFNPAVHLRDDLFVQSLSIEHQNDENGRFPVARLTIQNTLAPLDERWLHIAYKGVLVFHGQINAAPRGLVNSLIDIEAIAEPEGHEELLKALVESVKVMPDSKYDSLFVPEGAENDPAEVLSGLGSVIAWSRIAAAPVLCDPLSGSRSLVVVPNKDSLDVAPDGPSPASIDVTVEAEWRQLVIQRTDLSGRIGRIETLTSEALEDSWPKTETKIGDAFVISSSLSENERNRDVLTSSHTPPLGALQYDPAWAEGGMVPTKAESREYSPTLAVERRFEVRRLERLTFTVEAGVQPLMRSTEPETMAFKLNEISARSRAKPWQPDTQYVLNEEAIDGQYVIRANQEHRSGSDKTDAFWTVVGEPQYMSSRRVSSFFKTERGQAAAQHALERAKARLRFASRTVLVSCEAPLPGDLSSIGHDTVATIVSPDLIGGQAVGRVVDYTLHFGAREYMSLTIACAVGTGGDSQPSAGSVDGRVPVVVARMKVDVRNQLSDQLRAFNSGTAVPETLVEVTPLAPPATDITQDLTLPIEGVLSLPRQVNLA